MKNKEARGAEAMTQDPNPLYIPCQPPLAKNPPLA